MIMEKINVFISWSGDNYCADAHGDDLNGIIIETHKTMEGLKKDFPETLQFHIECCLKSGDILPEWLTSGQFELNYILETSALLHSLDGILTRSTIARISGINQRQIGHYASGHRAPRPQQREKIINGIHAISRELASVV
jgi:hypothetical protein